MKRKGDCQTAACDARARTELDAESIFDTILSDSIVLDHAGHVATANSAVTEQPAGQDQTAFRVPLNVGAASAPRLSLQAKIRRCSVVPHCLVAGRIIMLMLSKRPSGRDCGKNRAFSCPQGRCHNPQAGA